MCSNMRFEYLNMAVDLIYAHSSQITPVHGSPIPFPPTPLPYSSHGGRAHAICHARAAAQPNGIATSPAAGLALMRDFVRRHRLWSAGGGAPPPRPTGVTTAPLSDLRISPPGPMHPTSSAAAGPAAGRMRPGCGAASSGTGAGPPRSSPPSHAPHPAPPPLSPACPLPSPLPCAPGP
jgi:hypothetical protein